MDRRSALLSEVAALARQAVPRLAAACVAALLSAALFARGGSDGSIDPIPVSTRQGPVLGFTGEGVTRYLGIPFAAPPLGALRWRAPVAPAMRTGIYAATHLPQPCIQPSETGTSLTGSEDCLYLSIYRPQPMPEGSRLPVLLWIYGGGYTQGSSSDWDGGTLARDGNLVVITANYRLGSLGFFAHPGLAAESSGHAGNYGILDQQSAMQWVQDNVANFGGDPSNVLIWGQSSGGNSVYTHLASPRAAGLFQKAASLSGDVIRAQPTLKSSEQLGLISAQAKGCPGTDTIAVRCLRALPAAQALQLSSYSGAPSPVIDGFVLQESTISAFSSGRFNRVPFISGSAQNDGNLFAAGFLPTGGELSAESYAELIAKIIPGTSADDITTNYPASSAPRSADIVANAYGDYRFFCSALADSATISMFVPNTWSYLFAADSPPAFVPGHNPEIYPGPVNPQIGPWGDFHSSDLQYWFDQFRVTDRSKRNLVLSSIMRGYLTNFARSGDPNGPTLPHWSNTRSGISAVLNLAIPVSQKDNAGTGHHCAYWKTVAPAANQP